MSDFNTNTNNSNNNGNTFQNRITTSGMTLFDENGTMLRMGYLDESLSLVIGEPTLADNGKRTYPQERRHPFIITLDRAAALYQNIILEKVLPALENNQDYSGGVFINRRKDAILEIRIQDGFIYLIYYKEIQEDRTPKETYVFKFSKTTLVENYNPDGSSADQSNVEGFFALFCKYLEAGIIELQNAGTHSFRKANAYTTNAIFNYLKQIAGKLGITPNTNSNTGSYNTSSSGFLDTTDGPDEVSFDATPAATSLEGMLS